MIFFVEARASPGRNRSVSGFGRDGWVLAIVTKATYTQVSGLVSAL
ncbi:hypothetical protein Lpp22_2369 [Lacticaseibacillus paracasei subsp. paracasei Lpp22]|uniref:Uncharacterized protein n=1 Tax=Lacticaseibacillus paracasei subsp. paracasei Lpp22 TaxID=1256221 RepID=A0A8E0M4L8_LACPA|nr:hypothetical protein Lpp22_2369 [Lacticaseibacillus paracasei subsp. paracasei Lpp22]